MTLESPVVAAVVVEGAVVAGAVAVPAGLVSSVFLAALAVVPADFPAGFAASGAGVVTV